MNTITRTLSAALLALLVSTAAAEAPLFDVHLHYTWSQAEVTTPEQALTLMDEQGIGKAVIIGTPPELALQLYQRAPERIVPFFGPYQRGGEKLSWQFRDALVDEARAGLASGLYRGIGELHLIGGMAVDWRRSRVFVALLKLAEEFQVPMILHTEYTSPAPTLSICENNPGVMLLLAHAGAVLPPDKVELILQRCPNVSMDLAARDPWRYVNHPITDQDGRLLPAWEQLILNYPQRFMIGADTVWPVDHGSSWDIADTGWQELGRFIGFHRRWLSFLPAEVQQDLRWNNAARFLARPASDHSAR